jgi:hypothetical protein
MNTTALIMWLGAISTVTAFTAYFFYKVLTTPPAAKEEDEQPIPPVKSFDVS